MARRVRAKTESYSSRLQRSLNRWPTENPASATHDAVTVGRLDDAPHL